MNKSRRKTDNKDIRSTGDSLWPFVVAGRQVGGERRDRFERHLGLTKEARDAALGHDTSRLSDGATRWSSPAGFRRRDDRLYRSQANQHQNSGSSELHATLSKIVRTARDCSQNGDAHLLTIRFRWTSGATPTWATLHSRYRWPDRGTTRAAGCRRAARVRPTDFRPATTNNRRRLAWWSSAESIGSRQPPSWWWWL
jgi:hypothetical protein